MIFKDFNLLTNVLSSANLCFMPVVKALGTISEKWSRKTSQATQDYAAGVRSPRRSWAEATTAAAEAQATGVQAAIANNSFEKGVARAGNEKWSRGATGKGTQRFGPGVQAAKGDYEKGFAPYRSVIEGVSLPPRGAKGDPRNYTFPQLIGEALHNAKVGA